MLSKCEKQIYVNNYISTNEYRLSDGTVRSIIVNEKQSSEIILEDISAELWNVIVKTEDWNSVQKFADENGLSDDLETFLDELYYADFITYGDIDKVYDDVLFKNEKMVLHSDIEALNNFNLEKKEFLYRNNFLYMLELNPLELSGYSDTLKKAVSDAKTIGLNKIKLSAGNMQINDFWFEIAQYIRDLKISLEIEINPANLPCCDHVLFNTMLTRIIDLYPHRVFIPLYSTNKELQGELSGIKDSLDVVDYMIYKFYQSDVPVNIRYMNTDKNSGNFDEILEYTRAKGIELSCNSECLKNFGTQTQNIINDEYIIDETTDRNISLGKQRLIISKGLDITNSEGYSFGNLKDESMTNIWNTITRKG